MKVPPRGSPRSTALANALMLKSEMGVDESIKVWVSNVLDCENSKKMYLKNCMSKWSRNRGLLVHTDEHPSPPEA